MMLALLAWAQATETVRVEMVFPGLRSDDGQVLVMLFCSDEGFPTRPEEACHKATGPVTSGQGTVVFEALPAGVYAVSAIHDEDMDGALDTFLGMPKEGVGMIGKSQGIPSFQDASVELLTDKTLTGSTVYLL